MSRVFIIAEAGVNHNGSLDMARRLVDAAKCAGVDAIKFQTYKTENLVSRNARMADYQKANISGADDSQFRMLKKLELSYDEFRVLKAYCDESGIMFLSTAFDLESADFLEVLGMPVYKIPSGEITNLPYLIRIAGIGGKIILSTGMCELEEIEQAIVALREHGAHDIALLHCTTEYPAPFEDVNLRAMLSLKEKFGVSVGYSDHTKGIEIPIAAVALGAEIIEKHFTLDKNMDGPDHKASLDPAELKRMVTEIRNVSDAIGDGIKKPSASERKNIAVARKSIVASREIAKGEIFTEENITVKRPGTGVSPMRWFDVLGMKASKSYQEDELIEL